MKTLGILFIGLLITAIPVYSQQEERQINWKTVSEPREQVDFKMPDGSFTSHYLDTRTDGYALYRSTQGDSAFSVSASGETDLGDFDLYLAFASQFDPRCETRMIGRFVTYECSFQESGFSHSFKVFSTGHRFYRFYTYSKGGFHPSANRFLGSVRYMRELEDAKPIDRSVYESAWKQFINNMAEHSVSEDPLAAEELVESDSPGALPVKEDPRSDSPSSGIGSGSEGIGGGPGKGSQSGSETGKSKPKNLVPLQLLFEPKPGYTELARRFAISGAVRLRVVFYSDGTIGSIRATETLPFGLTHEAIKAAKKLTFRPQRINGTPVGVSKMVVFNFTIY